MQVWPPDPSLRASRTGSAQAQSGSVANSGIVYGDVRVAPGPVAARSGYGEQVRRIAPEQLLERTEELDELAAFCTGDSAESYLWWRAEAWAGKSALMAWFALHPPAGVRVVPFFITARFAAQNDRIAFTDVVLEQLSELLGEGVAGFLTESTREAHLLRLLSEAASACRVRGERLVLLVDGLDEDRGVTTGPDAYSIAALLPARPAAGMRVVVAGRTHPPIPDDVPEEHPLRRPGIVRELRGSPFAQVIQRQSERELKRLLAGTGVERDLLGLVTASGGGLSSADLAELVGLPPYEVAETLRSVAGRTFRARESHFRPGGAPETFVLGHEELQATAVQMLGAGALARYRERIHAWAADYRERGWPPQTPEYLLRGYFLMLRAVPDLPRMVACGTDAARHDRMLDFTGGDSAALTEIANVQDLLIAAGGQDLAPMLCLAIHRDALQVRNTNISPGMPAVWAALGQPWRAGALANSLVEPYLRVESLVAVAETLTAGGRNREAVAILADAVAGARLDTDPVSRTQGLARVGTAWHVAGEQHQALAALAEADTIASGLPLPYRVFALAAAGAGWWAIGERDHAMSVLAEAEAEFPAIADPADRSQALAAVARALADAGAHHRAAAVLAGADELARTVTDPADRGIALAGTGHALARIEENRERSAALFTEAVETIGTAAHRDWPLMVVATAMADAGFIEQAEALCREPAESFDRGQALAFVGQALAARGEWQRAEALARTVGEPMYRAKILAAVAKALVDADRHREARSLLSEIEAFARSAPDVGRARHLAILASALAAAGQGGSAAALLAEAEAAARTITDASAQAEVLERVGRVLARTGECERAEALAHTINNPIFRFRILVAAANARTAGGDRARAVCLLQQARSVAAAITDPAVRARSLTEAAEALAAAGACRQAAALARSITWPGEYGNPALAAVGRALGAHGEGDKAAALLAEAEGAVRTITDRCVQASELVAVAEGQVACGNHRSAARLLAEAEALARAAADVADGAWTFTVTLTEIGEALTSIGEREQAVALLTQAVEAARTTLYADQQDRRLASIGTSLAAAGAWPQAEALAHTISSPHEQAWLLTELARYVDEPAWARRLIAQALRTGSWTLPLEVLAVVDPETLPAAVAEAGRR